MKSKKLIFLFSLPRSGSTLVQRVLAVHDALITASEPWLLLSLIASKKSELTSGLYNVGSTSKAIDGFLSDYPGGEVAYEKKLNDFVYEVYESISNDDYTHILDKTPRYHCIASDIQRIFPEAKIIFLWRNPLSVCSSLLDSWGQGRWNLYQFYFDIFHGQKSMIEAFQKSTDCISIKYEDLVDEGSEEWVRLFDYLGLDNVNGCLEKFSNIKISGMGDQVGQNKYTRISSQSIHKWKTSFSNPLRVYWAKKYLKWYSENFPKQPHYDIDHMLLELSAKTYRAQYKKIFSDAFWMLYGIFYHFFNMPALKKQAQKALKKERVYASR